MFMVLPFTFSKCNGSYTTVIFYLFSCLYYLYCRHTTRTLMSTQDKLTCALFPHLVINKKDPCKWLYQHILIGKTLISSEHILDTNLFLTYLCVSIKCLSKLEASLNTSCIHICKICPHTQGDRKFFYLYMD